MERRAVVSSNIASIGHENDVLEVEFKGSTQNRVWQYQPVTRDTYDAIVDAPSVGRAFNELVKRDASITATDVTDSSCVCASLPETERETGHHPNCHLWDPHASGIEVPS